MKKLLLIFFIPVTVFSIEFFPPKVQLLEIPVELPEKDKNTLTDWSYAEMLRLVAKARSEDKRSFACMQSMALYRFTENPEKFKQSFLKISLNEETQVGEKDILLDVVKFILKRMAKGDNDSRRLAWYYYDYLCERYPDNEEYQKERDSLPQGNWITLIPGYAYRLDTLEEMAEKQPPAIGKEITVPDVYRIRARKLQKTEAKVNGLIVITLRNGKKTGMASEISATTYTTSKNNGSAEIDQYVGLDMQRSITSSMLALQKRYPFVQAHRNILFGFEEREAMKDGNSAGVAFTLLLYSLFEGIDIDQKLAVTGVIMPDCGVKAVGGVPSKIRGAWKKGLKIAVIPEENKNAVSDLTLMYELAILWNIQIFTAEHFTDVLPIAQVKKSENIQKAIDKFNGVAAIMNKGSNEIIKEKANIIKELQEVVKLAPNHESAQVLIKMLTGNRPKSLSLNGSVDFLFMMIERILSISPKTAYESSEEIITRNRSFLVRNLTKISKDAHPFAREIVQYTDSLIKFRKLMVLNIHNDKENIGTALNLMDDETEKMERTRERLQKRWEVLQKKL